MKKHITTFYRLTEEERRALIPNDTDSVNTPPSISVQTAENRGERKRISPRAAGLAAEYGINLAEVVPSGPHDRVIERDILAVIRASGRPLPAVPGNPEAVKAEIPDTSFHKTGKPITVKIPENEKKRESEPPRPCYSVGETIMFGTLREKPMKWMVVESSPEKALIVSLECVCEMPYSTERYRSPWEKSNIAKWLNGYFAYSAFGPEERKRILDQRIFLLREGEVRKYLRSAAVTDWEKFWWVRPDEGTAGVSTDGERMRILMRPTDTGKIPGKLDFRAGVRPALWIRAEK